MMASMSEIKAIRKELGLTQIEFGARLGIHQSQVSRWESGSVDPDVRTMMAARLLLREHLDAVGERAA